MERSDEFYFAPLVEFQVDGKLFCVPREGFVQSTTFVDLYGVTPQIQKQATVAIDNVKASEFTAFLKLLIRPPLGLKEHELCEPDLEAALKLSSLWDFGAIRASAISRLEALSLKPSRIIQLAHLYGVDNWIAPEIERLAFRPESLTFEEAEQVGLKTLVEVYTHRDTVSHFFGDIVKQHITDADMTRARMRISADVKKLREIPVEIITEDSFSDAEKDTNSVSDGEPFVEVRAELAESFTSTCSYPPKTRAELKAEMAASQAVHEERIAVLEAQMAELADAEHRAELEAIDAAQREEAARRMREEEAALEAEQRALEEEEKQLLAEQERFNQAETERFRREEEAAEQQRLANEAAASENARRIAEEEAQSQAHAQAQAQAEAEAKAAQEVEDAKAAEEAAAASAAEAEAAATGDADATGDAADEEFAKLESEVKKAEEEVEKAQGELNKAEAALAKIPAPKAKGKNKKPVATPAQKAAERTVTEAEGKVIRAREKLEKAEKALEEHVHADCPPPTPPSRAASAGALSEAPPDAGDPPSRAPSVVLVSREPSLFDAPPAFQTGGEDDFYSEQLAPPPITKNKKKSLLDDVDMGSSGDGSDKAGDNLGLWSGGGRGEGGGPGGWGGFGSALERSKDTGSALQKSSDTGGGGWGFTTLLDKGKSGGWGF